MKGAGSASAADMDKMRIVNVISLKKSYLTDTT
jgi:hypothetical protein